MQWHSVLNRVSLVLLFSLISILVFGTGSSVAAHDATRPESWITNLDGTDNSRMETYWIADEENNVTVDWTASDPDDREIDRLYFWACYNGSTEESVDCRGSSRDSWERIGYTVLLNEKEPSYTTLIPMSAFLDKFNDREGRYKLVTCAVNEWGDSEYGKHHHYNTDYRWDKQNNGCNKYKDETHNANFDSYKIKEFYFGSAPEAEILIDQYTSDDSTTFTYTITDSTAIASFDLEYRYEDNASWTRLDNGTPNTKTFEGNWTFENHTTIGEGMYEFRIDSTDSLGHGYPDGKEVDANTIYDITSPTLDSFTVVPEKTWVDEWDRIDIAWTGSDDVAGKSVSGIDVDATQIYYCYWKDVTTSKTEPPELWLGPVTRSGNDVILTVYNELKEGRYYLYPVLKDGAGNTNATDPETCAGEEFHFIFDKSDASANLDLVEERRAYNEPKASIRFSATDAYALKNLSLSYAYSYDEFSYSDADFSDPIILKILSFENEVSYNELYQFTEFVDPGTYRIYLKVNDLSPNWFSTGEEVTLIYDTEAPETEIDFGGNEPAITNQDFYIVYCNATDNHRTENLFLHYKYKESESWDYNDLDENNPVQIPFNDVCQINFYPTKDGFYQFYLIAEDEAGNKEEVPENPGLTIIYDSTSPNFELTGFVYLDPDAEGFMALEDNTVYYNSNETLDGVYDIQLRCSITDSLSGVDGTIDTSDAILSLLGSDEWSINYIFNASKTDEENKINLVLYDRAENSASIIINFKGDNTAPVFSLYWYLYNSALEVVDEDNVLLVKSKDPATEILFLTSDVGAPISSYELRLEDEEWTELVGNPRFSIPKDDANGETIDTISLRVTDGVGNYIIRNFDVVHDNEGPEFNPLNFGFSGNNNITYLNSSRLIQLSASDALSELESIEYRYDEEEWQNYVGPFDLFQERAQLIFSYRATDQLGNVVEKQKRFVIDNMTPVIDFSMTNITLVSNSGNDSKNRGWNGSQLVDYNEFSSLFLNLENVVDEEGGSGIGDRLIRYSYDNKTWLEYIDGIELNASSIYIRVIVSDNVSNFKLYDLPVVEVINVPIEEESESRAIWYLLVILLVVAAAASVGVYRHRHTLMPAEEGEEAPELEQEAVEPEPDSINCPNCSVMISTESKSCNFCGCSWDDLGNVVLGVPLATMEKQTGKEIVPRTGEILIGDGPERWKMGVGAKTSVGGRKNNEDSISWNQLIRSANDTTQSVRLGIVADGVGGHNKGEIASSVAISALNYSIGKSVNDPFRTDILSTQEHLEILEKAYHDCNNAVYKLASKGKYSGMATTAVSVYLWEEEGGSAGFIIGNVGDSRGYLINRNEIKQVTKDDSEVQKLVDSGEITEREARTHSRKNVITQAIGNKKKITPRTTTHLLENLEYDTVLICSDGVSDRLSNAEIHKIVKKYDNPQDVCDRIAKVINRTNTNHDNISVICIKFPNLLVGD